MIPRLAAYAIAVLSMLIGLQVDAIVRLVKEWNDPPKLSVVGRTDGVKPTTRTDPDNLKVELFAGTEDAKIANAHFWRDMELNTITKITGDTLHQMIIHAVLT